MNSLNIACEAAVPRSSVDSYFSVLQEILLADFLHAYNPNVKVREQTHPKLFRFDSGDIKYDFDAFQVLPVEMSLNELHFGMIF